MNRIGALLAVVLLGAPLCAQGKRNIYAPSEGRFSVNFPGKPREKTETAKSPLGELKVFTATYATSDGNAFMVSYTDFPEAAVSADNPGAMYDGVRDGLKGKEGTVLSEVRVEIGAEKHPGRDIEIENKKEKKRMKFRVVLVSNRLYQIAALGSTNFVTGKDADAFIRSFELAK